MAFFAAKGNEVNNVYSIQRPETTSSLVVVWISGYGQLGKDGMTHQYALSVI